MDSLISLASPVSVDPVGARAHAARSTREGAVLCGLGDGASGPSRREFASWVAGTGCPDDERFERVDRMRAISLDAARGTDLLDSVTVAIDRLLDVTLEGYETTTPRGPRPVHRGEPKR